MNINKFRKKYYETLFGRNYNAPLQRKILILLTVTTVIITFIGNITNVVLGFDLLLIAVTLVANLFTVFLYIKARNSDNYEKYANILFIASIVFLPVAFILNAGFDGNTISLFFVYFLGIYSIFNQRQRRRIFIIYLLSMSSLILLQYFYPFLIIPYNNSIQRFIDLIIGNILYFIIIQNIISLVLNDYKNEQEQVISVNEKLNIANESLSKKNQEIIESSKLLASNEERLRLVLDITNDGIWDWDTRRNRSYFSPRYYIMLGYQPDEFPPSYESWKSLVHPDDLEKADKVILNAASEGDDTYLSEFRMKSKNGDWKCILNRAKVIERDREGNIVRMLGVHSDITESKTAQKKLKESEERYRTLIETSPDGICLTSINGFITFSSQKALEMFGFFFENEVLGRKITDFFVEDEKERAAADFRNLLLGINPQDDTYQLRRKDGSIFYGQLTSRIIFDGKIEPIGIVTVARDVTEKKKLEYQLQIRQRMDSIGTLAGGIAHDFNNLLTGITGYLSIIQRAKNLEERQKVNISKALTASKRAAELTRQLQSLSKTDISEMSSIDIYSVAEEVFTLLNNTTDKIVEKIINFEKNKFHIYGNYSELHQVLLNLGTNSYHAIQERGCKPGDFIRISAELYHVAGEVKRNLLKGGYVHLTFEDNGKGMSENIISKAFDPLFTTKNKGGGQRGQGLGLAMVYNIVTRKHKGHIEIQSTLEKGTIIHIYLPKSEVINKEFLKINQKKSIGDETILIIEDEEFLRDISSEILEESGYNVIAAKDGLEGLEIFSNKMEDINLVILDLTMPGLGGLAVMEVMLKLKPEIPIVICSGHASETHKDISSILSNAKAFIHKPYEANDFADVIRNVLDNSMN